MKGVFNNFRFVVSSVVSLALVITQIFITTILTSQSAYALEPKMETVDYIVPDGTTNTTVDRAQNGTPVVNIATPNGSGMSHNKFYDYNVTAENLILNNFKGDVGTSQLGGALYGNPNLNASGSNPASLILNEVTSNRVSNLAGYTEIFGGKAALVIANPNGVNIAGAGFINTSRLSLITGTPNIDGTTGQIGNFTINPNAQILITARNVEGTDADGNTILIPLGLDASTTDYADIISRVVKVQGEIYAGGELNIKTGNKSYDYNTGNVESESLNDTPELAIDSTSVGGMYAGKINLIATENGVGVKTVGDLSADFNDVIIDAKGDVEYNNIVSENGNIEVTSNTGSITQNGVSNTNGLDSIITLNAKNNVTNLGQIISYNDVVINTNVLNNNTANSNILAMNNIDLNVISLDNSNANIKAGNNLTLRNLTLISPEVANAFGITNEATSITNVDGTFYAGNLLDFDLGNLADYEIIGTLFSAGNMRIEANNIINKTNLEADGAIEIVAEDTFSNGLLDEDNTNTKIIAGTNLSITSNNLLSNYGMLSARRNLVLTSLFGDINNNINAEVISGVTVDLYDSTGSLIDLENGFKAYKETILHGRAYDEEGNLISEEVLDGMTLELYNTIKDDPELEGYLDVYDSEGKIIDFGNKFAVYKNTILNNKAYDENGYLIPENIIGITTFTAVNGTVNQNSLHSIVINGDYSLDTLNFINTGRVDISGNLVLNVSNDLTNEEYAMIYAGGTMDLNVVNNLINKTGAVIYSEGDLTIQKYATSHASYDANNNRINKLDNISAEITSYAGNVNIDANIINNKRASIYTQSVNRWIGTCYHYEHEDHCSLHEEATYTGTMAATSKIYAGNNININFGYALPTLSTTSLTNQSSSIVAKNNINLNIGTLNNNSNSFKSYTKYLHHNHWWKWVSDWNQRIDGLPYLDLVEENFPATFKAGLDIVPNVLNDISNEELIQNVPIDSELNQIPNMVNGIDVNDLLNNGTIELNIDNYLNGPDDNGLFTRNSDPTGPLFESRSQFLNTSNFLGSDYFYQRLGLDPTAVQIQIEAENRRQIGDAFFISRMIEEQLRVISKSSMFISEDETDAQTEIDNLMNNAADEYNRLGLTHNQPLTQAQIDSLEKDIVWFETKTIDGNEYIVPVIYLAQTTRDSLADGNLASKSTIYAKNDITITSSNTINNTGSIVAGNNLNLTATNNISNNNFSELIAGNNLGITSTVGSIINRSKIQATNALTMNAGQDITNISTVLTNAQNLLDSGNIAYLQNNSGSTNTGNIASTIVETAQITAGSLVANAGNDFTNQGANITATGNATIDATNDINITSVEQRNRTLRKWGSSKDGGHSITDTTTNTGSELNIGGDLAMTSGNDTNILGSDISVTGDANIQTTGNLNIASVEDTYYFESHSNKDKTFGSDRKSSDIRSTSTNVASELDIGGTLTTNSTENLNIIASNLTADTAMNLNADGTINILSGKDTSFTRHKESKDSWLSESESMSQSAGTTQVASNLTTTTGDITINSGDATNVIASNIDSANNLNITSQNDEVNILTALDTTETITSEKEKDFDDIDLLNYNRGRISTDISFSGTETDKSTTTNTAVASNLTSNNNIAINSNQDLSISGSNLTSAGTIDLASTAGDINITSSENSTKTEEVYKDITETLSIGGGNAYVDAVYAVDDTVKATEAVKDAKEELSRIKDLRDQGKATDSAVKDAELNLAMATEYLAYTTFKLYENGKKIAAGGHGFYADAQLNTETNETTKNSASTTHSNSQIVAGTTLSTDSQVDTTISGANLLAQNIDITVGNDLTIESKQNTSSSDSESKNYSGGVSYGTGGAGVGGNFGMGRSESESERKWVDDQTTIIGTNSVNVNTQQNTNIKGAVIANIDSNGIDQGNLALNTNTLTYEDIFDYENQNSKGFNIGTGISPSNGLPGNLTFGINDSGSVKEQITRATVGQGTITVAGGSDITDLNRDIDKAQEITKDQVTGALDGEMSFTKTMLDKKAWLGLKDIPGDYIQGAKNAGTATINGYDNVIEWNNDRKNIEAVKTLNEGVPDAVVAKYIQEIKETDTRELERAIAKDVKDNPENYTTLAQLGMTDEQIVEYQKELLSDALDTNVAFAAQLAGGAIGLGISLYDNREYISDWNELSDSEKITLLRVIGGDTAIGALSMGLGSKAVKEVGWQVSKKSIEKQIPKNYMKKSMKKGVGVRYIDGKGKSVIVEKGWSNAVKGNVHAKPYVKISNGKGGVKRIPLKDKPVIKDYGID